MQCPTYSSESKLDGYSMFVTIITCLSSALSFSALVALELGRTLQLMVCQTGLSSWNNLQAETDAMIYR